MFGSSSMGASTSSSASFSSSPGTSPSRKVVTDFAAFGVPVTGAKPSVFGTAVASTPFSLAGKKAAFGGMRGGMLDMDDEDEDEDEKKMQMVVEGGQKVELREGSISLEQVSALSSTCRLLFSDPFKGTTNCDAKRVAKRPSMKRKKKKHGYLQLNVIALLCQYCTGFYEITMVSCFLFRFLCRLLDFVFNFF
jgi:hypothetical protein